MTIDKMIELLEAYREELGGETEVRTMTQSNYPFENGVAGMASTDEMDKWDETDSDEADESDKDRCVYIVEGMQIGYGRQVAWRVACQNS